MPTAIGSSPTLANLLDWPTEHLIAAAEEWPPIAHRWDRVFAGVFQDGLSVDWQAAAAQALHARNYADQAAVGALADQLLAAAAVARAGASDLVAARSRLRYAVDDAHGAGFTVGADLSIVDCSVGGGAAERADRQRQAEAFAADIGHRAAQLVALDQQVAGRIKAALNGVGAVVFDEPAADGGKGAIQLVDNRWKTAPADADEPDADRRRHQSEAFQRVFGRGPVSQIDWATAAALDPHSYDPRNQGATAVIRVARIQPRPGEGLVRAGQWIEQRDVWTWPPIGRRDFGNERVADPHFDPEATKVTTYIDYENGLVVLRQNPSVELDRNGGPSRVKVGTPQGRVWQNADGAVRIQYSAANPLVPPVLTHLPWPLADNSPTVNGDLVFTPGPGGVQVDGTRTNYPSLEIYQDLPNGVSHTVAVDPATTARSVGPMFNLERHHEIGRGGSVLRSFSEWHGPGDTFVGPKPPTAFGPVTNAPTVPAPPLHRVPA